MLEAFIIDELLEKERRDNLYRPRPHLERPDSHPWGQPVEQPERESGWRRDEDRDDGREDGVIILDM